MSISILKENKGVLLFYIVLAIATLILVNDAKNANMENKYINSEIAMVNCK